MDQFNCHFYVISRHAHFCSFRKFANTCYVCCSEVELRTVVVEEWSMTSTFIFCQNVNLSCKFVMACYRTWFAKNLSSFDFSSLNTTKQSTDVITSLSFVKKLTEHFHTCYNDFTCIFVDTNDFYFIRYMKCTTLYSTCSNSTTSCDREYVFDWHKERFVCVTFRIRNIAVNSIHKLHNLIAPFSVRIFQSFQSRTFDDRCVISREFVLVKEFTNFHLYEFKKFFIVYHVTFVHEYYDVRYTYLTGQKDVLSCLSHNTICSSYNKDSSVHLSSTCDHVLNVIGMTWAVNMCVVTFLCLILNVSCGDCDTTFSFFRCFIDILEIYGSVTFNSFSKSLCDSSC